MEADLSLIGQAEIWKYVLGFADTMALRCAVELRIPDIINESPSGGPISLSQIASKISADSSPNTTVLARVMRLLVRRNIFSAVGSSETILYGLTPSSKWLLTNDTSSSDQLSLAPLVNGASHPLSMSSFNHLAESIRSGETGNEMAFGKEFWGFTAENPEYSKIFNESMECTARIAIRAVLAEYDGFRGLATVVDVGGGTGGSISEIVKSYPYIKGINFDLPHVVATAPEYAGVSHIGGDMFQCVPKADAVFMKWIMHDWSDEDCMKILKNCRQAIPEKGGKLIIVEIVLNPEGRGLFDDTTLAVDLAIGAHTTGKERTEKEWKILLEESGFTRYNIIKIPALQSIIEAYLE